MKIRKTYILSITLIALLFFSCATFSKKQFRKEVKHLKKQSIIELNGDYSFNPTKKYSNLNKIDPEFNNAYQLMVNNNHKDRIKFDSIQKNKNEYFINLNIQGDNELRLKVFKNTGLIKDTIILGKYKKGMFYLDNNFLDCHGIPFIFGGCRNNKRRIGLMKNGNLIINEAVSNEGALLLIFGSGYRYNISYEYKLKQ